MGMDTRVLRPQAEIVEPGFSSPDFAEFVSSDPLLNRFWTMVLNSHVFNMHSILVELAGFGTGGSHYFNWRQDWDSRRPPSPIPKLNGKLGELRNGDPHKVTCAELVKGLTALKND